MRMSLVTAECPAGDLWIPPGKVLSGSERDILFTTGIGACIELAIHNGERRIGHMAHIFSTRSSQQEVFTELEAALESDGTDPSGLSAWMTGGSSEAAMAERAVLRTRAVEKLAGLGFSPDANLSVEWNDDEGVVMAAALDCASGTHVISPRALA
ncbi:MAG: hypothetical protein WDN27_04845 [Candidatus Saccharibacteria bacterium]